MPSLPGTDGADVLVHTEAVTFGVYFETIMELFENAVDLNRLVTERDFSDFMERCESTGLCVDGNRYRFFLSYGYELHLDVESVLTESGLHRGYRILRIEIQQNGNSVYCSQTERGRNMGCVGSFFG